MELLSCRLPKTAYWGVYSTSGFGYGGMEGFGLCRVVVLVESAFARCLANATAFLIDCCS